MHIRFDKSKIFILSIVIFLFSISAANAQTTAFTYQGRLNDSSIPQPTNGNYELLFKIYDANGVQQGGQIQVSNVAVANGIFTVQLDFGTVLISPATNLFLEIAVRPAGPQGAYTTLTPRQQITSAPFAVQALNAALAVDSQKLGGTNADQFVQILDPRLSDARNPLAGSSNYIQNTNVQQGANFNVSGSGTVGGTLTGNLVNSATQYNINNSRILAISGTSNLFAGIGAGANVSSGTSNAFFGSSAGQASSTASSNAFFGAGAGMNSNADFNSFFGAIAGQSNTSGNQNSFFGYQAGKFNTTGSTNAFFGLNAGLSNVAGSGNSFFGTQSGANNTASNNSFFGSGAGFNNTTATDSAFFGFEAGKFSNSSFNSFFGSNAGKQNTSGNQNSFFGYQAGKANSTGGANAFFGESAGSSNVSGFSNAFFGTQSGNKATGSNNSFFGTAAGNIFTSGNNNVFVGFNTGSTSTTESNNTLLGFDADINVGVSFSTAIGTGAKATLSHTIVLGTVSETVVLPNLGAAGSAQLCRNASNQISTCSSSRRYKTNIVPFDSGLNLVNRLQPVTFNWRADNKADFGLVAEDVAAVEPLLATYNEKGEVEDIKYDRVGVVLINAVKEQQAQIEKQNEQIKEQQKTIDALKSLVCAQNPNAEVCQEEK
jgi:hypothetical protein